MLEQVNRLRANPLLRSRYPPAILAGLLLSSAFPKVGIAGLAWIAPGLMVASAFGKRGAESFRIGYISGLAYYLASLYWLLLIPYRWHGIPLGPAAGWLSLSAYAALYPAAWVWFVLQGRSPESKVLSPESAQGSRVEGRGSSSCGFFSRFTDGDSSLSLSSTWAGRTLWALSGAAAWVVLEMLRNRLFSGFPWNPLGSSQYRMAPLIQIASVTGVYGVSFLAVWVALSALSATLRIFRNPQSRTVWLAEVFLPILAVAVVFNLGMQRTRSGAADFRTLKVTFIQPSIPQSLIWDASNDDMRFRGLLALTEQALTNSEAVSGAGSGLSLGQRAPGGCDLLLWPEAAVPKLLRYYDEMYQPVTALAQTNHIWMILGADDMEPSVNPAKGHERDFFNSSFLISPEGKLRERYNKRNLVIFGEYIPLEHWLPFLKFFTPIDEGGFTSGTLATQFDFDDLKTRAGVLICFEDVFPGLARDSARDDTDFLVNLTNDGWFGEGAEQWQHTAAAVFRAVENGVPLLRCSNNGLTCWADAHGQLRQVFTDKNGSVYGSGFMTAEIPLPPKGEHHTPTFYHQHGDWFGWGCVVLAGVSVVLRCSMRGKATVPTQS